jgi:hypothetical protein
LKGYRTLLTNQSSHCARSKASTINPANPLFARGERLSGQDAMKRVHVLGSMWPGPETNQIGRDLL